MLIELFIRREEKIREIANMDLCTKFSCYHCHGPKCVVREDAIRRLKND